MLPGAARAVAQLNAVGLRTVLVSNQRWLSGPTGDPACFAAIHARLERLLAVEGAWLDVSYYCPHAIGSCECRKPGSGMLRRAAREYGFNLAQTVIVGDTQADLEAGRSVGAATILLRADNVNSTGGASASVLADAVADDLPAAVRIILQTLDQAGLRHAKVGPAVMPVISAGLVRQPHLAG